MNLVSQYVIKVGAYVLFALLLEGILPQGSSKKLVKLLLSLVFLYVLIGPVVSWLELGLPLEELTTVNLSSEDIKQQEEIYQSQATSMVQQGWRTALQQNMPRELAENYEIIEVEMNEKDSKLKVKLARNQEIGSLVDRSLDLGHIGRNQDEEERIKNSLCEQWKVPPENLEITLK